MWSEYDVIKAKKNIQNESDPDGLYSVPKSKSDKIWVGIVWGIIGIMFIGMIINKMG